MEIIREESHLNAQTQDKVHARDPLQAPLRQLQYLHLFLPKAKEVEVHIIAIVAKAITHTIVTIQFIPHIK